VVDADFIDGADRGIGISIRGQQSALGFGKDLARFLKKLHAIHFRHALVGQQESDAVAAELQLVQKIKRRLGSIAGQHTVLGSVVRTQVALDGSQNVRVIIHGE